MPNVSGRRLTSLAALAAVLVLVLSSAATGADGPLPGVSARGRVATDGDLAPALSPPAASALRSQLERTTDLEATIDSVRPATLTRGQDLTVKGMLDDTGNDDFANAKVYLEIETDPATSRRRLTDFSSSSDGFGTRLVEFGLFDEIGRLDPGTTTAYKLTIPFGKLPISQTPGIYHVGVTVIAGVDVRRPVARAQTLVPLLPSKASGELIARTGVVTLIPMAAQIRRTSSGIFLDDDLASLIAFGGQLRNLLDFVTAAPPHTLEVVLDPALRQAVADMADGYRVRSLAEETAGEQGHSGQGEAEAETWLADLDAAVQRQDLLFMAWGSPDASALGSDRMPGVVKAAVRASQRYAADQRITTTVASWPYAGAATRRGLAVAAVAGAPLRIVSQRSLTNLRGNAGRSYPPTQVLVPTVAGQTTALVTRTEVAGDLITPALTGEELLHDIVAEATVRALDKDPAATSVIAVPFGWDPGNTISDRDLEATYGFPTVEPRTATAAVQETAVPYNGPIRMPRIVAGLTAPLLDSISGLGTKGRVYSELLSDQGQAVTRFDQLLAEAGTSLWRSDADTRIAVNSQAARQSARRAGRVQVTGPTFLALSSGSGRFPLTVTNGLPDPVTVQVVVRADNPAVRVDPIEQLHLDPGQRRDIEATARTSGSGLTTVRIQLTTANSRAVGRPWSFDIRSTQIGVAIWVGMGVVATILFLAAGLRIYQRIRSGGMQTREEPSP